MNAAEITERFELACRIARRAGMMAEYLFAGGVSIGVKTSEGGDPTTLVTEGDTQVEAYLVSEIRRAFPKDDIVGEEAAHTPQMAEFCWVLDPIDGTGNFAVGLRPWAVSIGVLRRWVPVIGIAVVEGNLYATHGEAPGVYRDGVLLPPLTNRRPQTVAHECLHWLKRDDRPPLDERALRTVIRSTRSFGSIVSSCVFVASGKLDAFVYPGAALWDFAASALLVEKAGGCITRWSGHAPFPHVWEATIQDFPAYLKRVYRYDLIAGTPCAYDVLLPLVQPYAGDLERGPKAA